MKVNMPTAAPPFPIDIVICWCSGPPPARLLPAYTCADPAGRGPRHAVSAKGQTGGAERYSDARKLGGGCKAERYMCSASDDLRYCLRSIAAHMPWYRRLWLVVADFDTLPDWLRPRARGGRLSIVRHSDFMPREALPAFNIHVIDSYVDRIPGLAAHFVRVDDDMYAVRPVPWTHFFTPEGRAIARHMPGPGVVADGLDRRYNLYTRNWAWLARRYGLTDYRHVHHPQAFTKAFIRKYRERIGPTTHHAFRRLTDINVLLVAGAMASQYGDAVRTEARPGTEVFFESSDRAGIARPLGPEVILLCINNAVTADRHVYEALERLLPRPSIWERI